VSLAPSGRYVARFIEIIVFAMLLALIALPAPARDQTFTVSSVTATPATVQLIGRDRGRKTVQPIGRDRDRRNDRLSGPTNLEPPGVSGTAPVGQVLASTTGTWIGATSFAYQWAGNNAQIAGATAATYTLCQAMPDTR
jgi:hypothetical protein